MTSSFPVRIIGVIAVFFSVYSGASAQTKLYYADGIVDDIRRMNTDGTDIEDVATVAEFLFGVRVDEGAGKIYWYQVVPGSIHRANLDGSDPEEIITGVPSLDFAIDIPNQKIYWTDDKELRRANTDGTNNELLNADLGNSGTANNIVVDSAAGQLYYGNGFTNEMMRVNTDGSGVTSLFTGDGLPWGMDLDLVNGHIYWAESNSPDSKLRRANLDGTNIVDIATGLSSPTAVAVDPVDGKVFWSEVQGGGTPVSTLKRANLDGSDVEVLFADTPVVAMDLGLLAPPEPQVPAVSTWGLLVLLMGMLVGATLVIQRRRQPA